MKQMFLDCSQSSLEIEISIKSQIKNIKDEAFEVELPHYFDYYYDDDEDDDEDDVDGDDVNEEFIFF